MRAWPDRPRDHERASFWPDSSRHDPTPGRGGIPHEPILIKYFPPKNQVLHTVAYTLYGEGDHSHSVGLAEWVNPSPAWASTPARAHASRRFPLEWHTVSGRGRGADDAPARLHQTPLGPEGRAVRPGRHLRPGPFRSLDRSRSRSGLHPCHQTSGSAAPRNERG